MSTPSNETDQQKCAGDAVTILVHTITSRSRRYMPHPDREWKEEWSSTIVPVCGYDVAKFSRFFPVS
jgi:hypothetical protein